MKIKTAVLVLLLGILMAFGITAYAETEGNYVYSVTNDVATITGVADKTTFTGEQVIPEKIGDYTVTKIAASAFKDCTGLTAITVPDTVTSIGKGALEGCTSLTELTMPKDVYGQNEASRFGYIFGYTTVTQEGWSSSTYPSFSSNYIPGGTYASSTGTYQNYHSTGSNSKGNGCRYYYYYNIPASLKKVSITNDTDIGASVFYNCESIETVELCNTITTVGASAFYNCNTLTTVL